MSKKASSLLLFDSHSLRTVRDLKNAGKAIHFTQTQNKNGSLIVLNGSYAQSHEQILQLASKSKTKTRAQLERAFSVISTPYFDAFNSLSQQQDKHRKEMLPLLEQAVSDIFSLLLGISYVKEISNRSLLSLLLSTSKISSILLATLLKNHYPSISPAIQGAKKAKTLLNTHNTVLIPVETTSAKIDFLTAKYAIQFNVQRVAIWSKLMGIRTADPKILHNTLPIKELDYNTALEISYLGGKFLHPSALSILSNIQIPIAIHSLDDPSAPITIIHKKAKLSEKCVAITHRNKFVMLTLRSANMFNQYGFLEQLFSVCNQYRVSIETLTTSEISITMTFDEQFFSHEFIRALSKLGEIEYKQEQSIVSIIGKHYWTDPTHIASILQALAKLRIGTISLGQSGTNLSIVLDSHKLKTALQRVHSVLFHQKKDADTSTTRKP